MSAPATVEVTLTLPEPLAREADAAGLLKPSNLEALLRDAIRRRRVDHLFQAADHLAALGDPPLTSAEVEAEIQAVRKERRGRHAGGS